jgi:glycosyltransferase involved in cell wall biosynthesis
VVIPSLHESFGLSVLDSFICKIPVIARNSMALPEIIDNERNGLLFTNEKDLASHMGCLLENPEFYKKLVENAYSDVINHFSAQRMAEEYKNLYDKVLAH